MKTTYKLVAVMIVLSVIAPSCEKGIKSNDKIFDVERFKLNLQTQLTTAPIGYTFVISKNGNFADSASFGMAALNPTGGGSVPQSVFKEINIASVTKTFTAIAAIQLITKNNLSIDSPIGRWLPGYWTKSQVIYNTTFKQLLTHTSGILSSNTGWDTLKYVVSRPLANPSKSYSYANVNFALFRAMIPYLDDQTATSQQETSQVGGGDITGFETSLANQYVAYMQQHIYTPAQINNALCRPINGSVVTQGFSETQPGVVAQTPGDWTEISGGGGYYLSAWEMAGVMAYLAHTQDLLTTAQRKLMDDNMLGWDPGDSPTVTGGKAYGKDGALFWDNNTNNVCDLGDSGLQTLVVKFPNGVEISLIVNSIPNGFRSLINRVQFAYESAWVDQ